MLIEGSISVKAALAGGRRSVEKVLAARERQDRNTRYILRLAAEKQVPVERLPADEIASLASGRTHGGILAEAGPRQYDPLDSALAAADPFLVLLEGVEDPYNLGYIIRTLYASGCSGLILPERDWSNSEPIILRSSAGASEYLPLILTAQPAMTVQDCRKAGLQAYAAMRREAVSYLEADYRSPILLAIGGEMRGLSRPVLEACQQNIYIPYANDFRNALNAAAAAAVLSYEVYRQRAAEK